MAVTATTVCVLEGIEVLARGLEALLADALPDSSVRVLPDIEGLEPGDCDLVVAGPSMLGSWSAVMSEAEFRPATLAVVADPGRVDFASLLAAGVAVLWDYRGGRASLGAAAQAALSDQTWVSESLTPAMATGVGDRLRRDLRAADFGLTQREGEILQLLATGSSNRDIAAQLFISQNTVKNHVRSVLEKLHAQSRTDAVMIGVRAGLIDARVGRG